MYHIDMIPTTVGFMPRHLRYRISHNSALSWLTRRKLGPLSLMPLRSGSMQSSAYSIDGAR